MMKSNLFNRLFFEKQTIDYKKMLDSVHKIQNSFSMGYEIKDLHQEVFNELLSLTNIHDGQLVQLDVKSEGKFHFTILDKLKYVKKLFDDVFELKESELENFTATCSQNSILTELEFKQIIETRDVFNRDSKIIAIPVPVSEKLLYVFVLRSKIVLFQKKYIAQISEFIKIIAPIMAQKTSELNLQKNLLQFTSAIKGYVSLSVDAKTGLINHCGAKIIKVTGHFASDVEGNEFKNLFKYPELAIHGLKMAQSIGNFVSDFYLFKKDLTTFATQIQIINQDSNKFLVLIKIPINENTDNIYYKAIKDSNIFGIFVINSEGIIVETNDMLCRIFEYPEKELIGQKFSILLSENLRAKHDFFLKKVFDDPKPLHLSVTKKVNGRPKYKKSVPIDVQLSPFSENGKMFVLVTIMDVTEDYLRYSELETANNLNKLATSAARIGTWSWDLQTEKLVWDEQMFQLYSIKKELIKENGLKAFLKERIPCEDRSKIEVTLASALVSDSEFKVEFRYTNPDNEVKFIQSSATIERDKMNSAKRLVGVDKDITEYKLIEKELLRSNRELEQFAYITSHDLQEPLRSISAFTQLLQEEFHENLSDQAKTYMNFIITGTRRMKSMIEGLLLYSRAGSSKINLELVKFDEVLDDVKSNLTDLISTSKAQITLHLSPLNSSKNFYSVYADRNQLTQLIQNLLGNALKYKKPNQALEVQVLMQYNDAGVIISIKDNGIGIESKFFEKIFEVFRRLHSNEKYEGTGIGLAICKKIVERHKGRIWVESVIEQGSTFSFFLPGKITL